MFMQSSTIDMVDAIVKTIKFNSDENPTINSLVKYLSWNASWIFLLYY